MIPTFTRATPFDDALARALSAQGVVIPKDDSTFDNLLNRTIYDAFLSEENQAKAPITAIAIEFHPTGVQEMIDLSLRKRRPEGEPIVQSFSHGFKERSRDGKRAQSKHLNNLTNIDIQTQTAPVPEPATMLLLASGLVGLAGLRKKFKRL